MKFKQLILGSLLTLGMFAGTVASASDAKTINISAFDTMKYSVTSIEVSAGEKVTVTLKNEGNLPKAAMAHNWVLLAAGTDPNAYARLAMTAQATNYQPKALASRVIASLPLLGPGESASVTFTAPTTPGNYAYLCSFPAHCSAGMHGVLTVK
jgi:azurin